MTICPRCGRIADGEIVCAECGLSLVVAHDAAESSSGLMDELGFDPEREGWSGEARTWRVAALAAVICLVSLAGAIYLLNLPEPQTREAALPRETVVSSVPPDIPSTYTFGPEPTLSFGPEPTLTFGTASPRRSPRATPTTTSTRSSSAGGTSSSRTGAGTSGAPTTSGGRPSTSSARPTTSAPRTTASSTAPAPSVTLAKGNRVGQCGPHCYSLVVTLSHFGSGSHGVTCHSGREGQFDSYTTSATTSTNCTFSRRHDSVWVRVDGRYQSNTVTW